MRRNRPNNRGRTLTGAVIALAVLAILGTVVALTMSSRESRRVEQAIETYTPPTIAEPEPSNRDTVAFLGDSFTEGTGAESPTERWTTLLAQSMGWEELNYGYGGTNYATGGELQGGRPYTERVPDIVASHPDIVIVSSAGNDLQVDQQPGITATFERLRAGSPEARIIATSPYVRAGEYPPSLVEFSDQIRAGVESVNGEYLDIGHPLGDHPDAMAEDGSHPNSKGHRLIADAVRTALER